MKLDNDILFEASKLKLGDRLKFDFYDSPVTVMYNKDDGYHFIADDGKFFYLFIITDHNYVYYLETLLPTTEKGQTRKFTQEDLLKAMGLKIGDKVQVEKAIVTIYQRKDKSIYYNFEDSVDFPIENLIGKEYTIIPQPKYTLTETEKHIVLAMNISIKWVARSPYGELYGFSSKPFKSKRTSSDETMTELEDYWRDCCGDDGYYLPFDYDLFQFIQWTDEEPVSLDELREIAKAK